jgi:tRNA U34 5-carboxymethylaminomethyl modifying enzyme MnmG/GidA
MKSWQYLAKIGFFADVNGLSNEVRQKLIAFKPQTLGQQQEFQG